MTNVEYVSKEFRQALERVRTPALVDRIVGQFVKRYDQPLLRDVCMYIMERDISRMCNECEANPNPKSLKEISWLSYAAGILAAEVNKLQVSR